MLSYRLAWIHFLSLCVCYYEMADCFKFYPLELPAKKERYLKFWAERNLSHKFLSGYFIKLEHYPSAFHACPQLAVLPQLATLHVFPRQTEAAIGSLWAGGPGSGLTASPPPCHLSDQVDHWDSDFCLKRTCCDPCHCINHITVWECEHDWFNLIPQNTLEKGFILAILENKPIYYSCPSLIVITVTHSWLQKPLMWAHKYANTITTPKNPRLSPPSMDLIISESCKTLPQSEAKGKKKRQSILLAHRLNMLQNSVIFSWTMCALGLAQLYNYDSFVDREGSPILLGGPGIPGCPPMSTVSDTKVIFWTLNLDTKSCSEVVL